MAAFDRYVHTPFKWALTSSVHFGVYHLKLVCFNVQQIEKKTEIALWFKE